MCGADGMGETLMAQFAAVTHEHHAARKWPRPNSCGFAAGDAVMSTGWLARIGDIVVIDNLPAHKRDDVRKIIEAAGATLR